MRLDLSVDLACDWNPELSDKNNIAKSVLGNQSRLFDWNTG
jgi:hypothetical protein